MRSLHYEQDWGPTVIANWKVWIPFQIMNFSMVPAKLQVSSKCNRQLLCSIIVSVFEFHLQSAISS